MAFKSDTGESEATRRGASRGVDMSWDNAEMDREPKAKRDWKRFFLVTGLAGLSWVATYVGMLELVEANMGELPLIHKLIIGFSVAMLMVMVVWLLDQMFSDIGWFTRLLFGAGYVFLTVISIGFGFGFYWKVLESRSEASRSAESAVGQVQTSLHAAVTRLEQLQGTLDSLTNISTSKADTERQAGTSCPNSKPGDGPRRKMRDDDAGRFKFAADFVKGRVGTVKTDISELNSDLARIAGDDKSIVDAKSGTRNEFMRALGRKLDLTVVGFNAFRTDPQLKQIRMDLNERSDKVTFVDTKGGTYTCPDGQLTTALKGVVRAIDELPSLEKPKIATVEGSEAVIEAFRRLTATFYGALAFKMPPSPEELRELQKKAVQSAEATPAAQAKLTAMADQAGLSKRDYVPLAIAMFVDLCLLLVSMKKATGRLNALLPKMRAAERGPVIQILSRFNEIHHDKQIRENFEVFRHVVFDFHGDYYAAVPLNAPYRPNLRNGRQGQGYGVSDAEELIQEAHLLANLFASFEKEKIFTRVHSPLLGTKTIQKRLRRQGSKFANSEAFRVYRFKDGAWSDIILGAVMGAARRVEADKRRRRVEEDIFRDTQPTLAPDAGVAASQPQTSRTGTSRPQASGPGTSRPNTSRDATFAPYGFPQPGMLDAASAGMASPLHRTPQYPYVVAANGLRATQDIGGQQQGPQYDANPALRSRSTSAFGRPELVANQNGPQSHPGWMPQPTARPEATGQAPMAAYSMARAPAPWPRPRDAADQTRGEGTDARSRLNLAPDTAPADGYRADLSQSAAPSPMPAGENVVPHPAMSRQAALQPQAQQSTAPARPSGEARSVSDGALAVALAPAASPKQATVTVEAVRETVTYTLPVSEANLPQSLFRATTARQNAEIIDTMATPVELITAANTTATSPETAMLPPPAKPAVTTAPVDAIVISLPEAAAEQAARQERTAWEMANQAGFEAEQSAALEPHLQDTDELRTLSMRFAPERRDG